MAQNQSDYYVFPSVVRMDVPTEIRIIPRGGHAAFRDDLTYRVRFVPMECFNVAYRLDCFSADYDTLSAVPQNGVICFTYTFTQEQEWSVVICPVHEPENEKIFHVFSVQEDLYCRTPYCGDLHTHSNGSDGREAPAIVAANYRKAGFDFIALTDHHRYWPSLEAIDAYRNVTMGFKLFPGEEVHVPGNYVHMVNFGGSYSVNELYEADPEACSREVEALAKSLSVEPGINPVEYAWRVWIVEHIRKGGGIAILAHPFWTWCHEYNMQTKLTRYMFREGCLDAFELLGGLEDRENNLQVALYMEARAEGLHIPIVGSSDSHGTDPAIYFGDNCTVVLMEGELTQEKLKHSILHDYSAAVGMKQWRPVRVYGTFRMVKYVQFLLDNYFPRHNELCIEEGILMKDYVCGDADAGVRLETLRERTVKFERCFFGRETAD